jgi:hypothetical protein
MGEENPPRPAAAASVDGMEPSDQPPPTPQTWAETSAWAPVSEEGPAPVAWSPPHASVAPLPSAEDYVRPAGAPGMTARARRERSRRTPLVLAALLTEVVVIAASNNQWVTEKVERRVGLHHTLLDGVLGSSQTFQWRLSAPGDDVFRSWPASLVLLAGLFIVTAALVAVLARTMRSFWGGFLGAGLVVVFATQVGVIAGAAVFNLNPRGNNGIFYRGPVTNGFGTTYSPAGSKATQALFGPLSPSGHTFLGSVMLGLVVGLAVGLVARRAEPAAAASAVPARPSAAGAAVPAFFPAPAPGIVPPGLLPAPPGALPQGPPRSWQQNPPQSPQQGPPQSWAQGPAEGPPQSWPQGPPQTQTTTVLPSFPGEQGTSVLPTVADPGDTTVFPSQPGQPGEPGRHSR